MPPSPQKALPASTRLRLRQKLENFLESLGPAYQALKDNLKWDRENFEYRVTTPLGTQVGVMLGRQNECLFFADTFKILGLQRDTKGSTFIWDKDPVRVARKLRARVRQEYASAQQVLAQYTQHAESLQEEMPATSTKTATRRQNAQRDNLQRTPQRTPRP